MSFAEPFQFELKTFQFEPKTVNVTTPIIALAMFSIPWMILLAESSAHGIDLENIDGNDFWPIMGVLFTGAAAALASVIVLYGYIATLVTLFQGHAPYAPKDDKTVIQLTPNEVQEARKQQLGWSACAFFIVAVLSYLLLEADAIRGIIESPYAENPHLDLSPLNLGISAAVGAGTVAPLFGAAAAGRERQKSGAAHGGASSALPPETRHEPRKKVGFRAFPANPFQ